MPRHNKLECYPAQALAGQNLSMAQIRSILAEVDKDGNGEVDFNEFCLLLRSQDLLGGAH
jgi:Ca2+-binding EF-hand superfamily protein